VGDRSAVLAGAAQVAILLCFAGCTSRADLQPAAQARPAPGLEDAAVAAVSGVRITAQAVGWPGEADVLAKVQPMRMIIENRSGEPLLVVYENFALLGPRGRTFAALPPYRIQGTVNVAWLEEGHGPVADPAFSHSGFELSPMYRDAYPGVPVAPRPIFGNPVYYDHFHRRLAEMDLPTPAMVRRALPEGALMDGGRLEGYLYFEKVPPVEVEGVVLRAELVNVATGGVIGTAAIPFRVDEAGLRMAEGPVY
jgi:hypothetical protein